MEVSGERVDEVFEAWVWTSAVDGMDVGGYVVYGKILHFVGGGGDVVREWGVGLVRGNRCFLRCHGEGIGGSLKGVVWRQRR